jgi:hypothetical protein
MGLNISGRELVGRLQDRRGRISGVHVRPTEMRVQVDGDALKGTVVELAGYQPGPLARLSASRLQRLRFPLPGGLPDGAWVVLRRDDEWLDRRFLAWPYARERQPGVEIEIEPATRLEALISGGEGPTIEFKEELPTNEADSKRNVMKTVAAFANGDGGAILFGVTNEGQIDGVDQSLSRGSARDMLARLVHSWVSPLPQFRIEALNPPVAQDRVVLILTVERHGAAVRGRHQTDQLHLLRPPRRQLVPDHAGRGRRAGTRRRITPASESAVAWLAPLRRGAVTSAVARTDSRPPAGTALGHPGRGRGSRRRQSG